ncbi:hypothetical protein V1522DRAFT_416314 [Lipomyces starkeyi]
MTSRNGATAQPMTRETFIASNTILTGAEGQRRTSRLEDVVQRKDEGGRAVKETRTTRRCSRCNQSGHTSCTCKVDT